MLGESVTRGDGPAAPQGWWLQPPPGSAKDPGASGGGTEWCGISIHTRSGGNCGDWEHCGDTLLFLWGMLALEGVRSEPMAPEGRDPFSPLALCHLLLKSMALVMVFLLLWDCHPPSKLAPKCPICLGQPHFGKCPRRTTPLSTTKCPTSHFAMARRVRMRRTGSAPMLVTQHLAAKSPRLKLLLHSALK